MQNEHSTSPYPVTQSDIDPRLQESLPTPQSYTSVPPIPSPSSSSASLQPQQQYTAPPQWPQVGYNAYYGSPNQLPYQPYQNLGGVSTQTPMHHELSESKRSRACETCRGLKVRCEPDLSGGPCKRCAKSGRHCVIAAPTRKRQKKTDSKVEELERKIDALTQSLKSTREGDVTGGDDGSSGEEGKSRTTGDLMGNVPYHQSPANQAIHDNGQKRAFSEFQQDGPSEPFPGSVPFTSGPRSPVNTTDYLTPRGPPVHVQANPSYHENKVGGFLVDRSPDVVGRGMVSISEADELFVYYKNHMSPHMPIVAFANGTASDTVRKNSPILFLAILSVASIIYDSNLRVALTGEVMHILGERIFASSEKSLELVQALQVVTVWYWPDLVGDSKYFQFVQFATAMAMALGINEEAEPQRPQAFDLGPSFSISDTGSVECRRAWLGCYLLSSNISMGRRRLNPVRTDHYLLDSLTILRDADDGVESDDTLCDLVQLQVFADDLANQILPGSGTVILESRVRSAHKGFERQIRNWQESEAPSSWPLSLSQAFNVVNLYMHELAMQHVAYAQPSKQPSRARSKSQSQASPIPSSSNTALDSTIGIMDTFAKFDPQENRSLPVFLFAQLGHAAISLIKMYFVAKRDPDFSKHNPVTSEMVISQLGRLIDLLRSTSREGTPLAAASFLKMMTLLKDLFEDHKEGTVESVRAQYGGIPAMKKIQILDLEDPQPTPQQRTLSRQVGKTAHGALQLLSEVATGKSNAEESKSEGSLAGGPPAVQSRPEDSGVAAMGKLIGEGFKGPMDDEGIFGIMQTMWAKRVN